jgi:hypothetical protein
MVRKQGLDRTQKGDKQKQKPEGLLPVFVFQRLSQLVVYL